MVERQVRHGQAGARASIFQWLSNDKVAEWRRSELAGHAGGPADATGASPSNK